MVEWEWECTRYVWYISFLIPAILLTLFAQWWVKSRMKIFAGE